MNFVFNPHSHQFHLDSTTKILKRKRKVKFDSNGSVAYVIKMLNDDDREIVRQECMILNKNVKKELNSIAIGRKGCICNCENIREIFSQDYVMKRLFRCTGDDDIILNCDVPVEYRRYVVGSRMDWHVDDKLFEIPQYELVSLSFSNLTSVH